MRLEEAVELLPDEGGPDLLVMELATGGERTIDGIANGSRVVLGHPKTREAMRAGLAMYFVTLDDDALMALADRIVAELAIEWFFNIQLVGDFVIEINPRISTIVYQEDLNLPYLGVKRALGEISDDELEALRPLVRPGRTALRYFDQLEWDGREPMVPPRAPSFRPPRPRSGPLLAAATGLRPRGGYVQRPGGRRPAAGLSPTDPALREGHVNLAVVPAPRDRLSRVVHCPVNTAGVPWTNVQALRGAGSTRARRLQPIRAPPRGRPLARPRGRSRAAPARAVEGARAAAPARPTSSTSRSG